MSESIASPAPDFPNVEQLDQYLAGECRPEEQRQVERWLSHYADGMIAISVLRHMRRSSSPVGDVRVRWAEMRQRIADVPSAGKPVSGQRVVSGDKVWHSESGFISIAPIASRTRGRIWSVIAGATLGVVLVLSGWYANAYRIRNSLASDQSIYATENGERATITLPDSTTVLLNVASRLQVPADYSTGNRTVYLEGEALFSVTHQTHTPFTVVSGNSITRVLGTAFVVRRYAEDSVATITVRDGKVDVGGTVITANQQLQYGNAGLVSMGPSDLGHFTFEAGVLTLTGVPLQQAVVELNRWYNADIRLADPALRHQKIGGKFAAGSVAELANILELTFDVHVVRDQRTLTLYPGMR